MLFYSIARKGNKATDGFFVRSEYPKKVVDFKWLNS